MIIFFKYFLILVIIQRGLLISSFLQPFINGPGQDVSSELKQRYFTPTFRHGSQGSRRWAVMYTSHVCMLWCVRFFAAPWTTAHQAPLSMEFSRQEYWSGLPFPSPGDLPYPGIKPGSPTLQADPLPAEPAGKLDHSVQFSCSVVSDSATP